MIVLHIHPTIESSFFEIKGFDEFVALQSRVYNLDRYIGEAARIKKQLERELENRKGMLYFKSMKVSSGCFYLKNHNI